VNIIESFTNMIEQYYKLYLWRLNFNLHGRILVKNLMAILPDLSWWCSSSVESSEKKTGEGEEGGVQHKKMQEFCQNIA